jgi:putative ABC transport system substrate-binding protein
MKRRTFIAGLWSVAAWPVVARAQQAGPIRRIGVLSLTAENDVAIQPNLAAFREVLKNLGWIEGVNMRLDVRYGGGVSTTPAGTGSAPVTITMGIVRVCCRTARCAGLAPATMTVSMAA